MSDEIIPDELEEVLPDEPVKDEKPKKGRGRKEKVKKEKAKKKGKGKVVLILSIVVLLLGGGFVGAAFMGLIPGLKLGGKPVAKKKSDSSAKSEQNPTQAAQKPAANAEAKPPAKPRPVREASPEEPPKKKVPAVTIDPEKGAKAIARIWEKMEAEKLAEIAATYKDIELARVMRGMETKKAAALLALLPADRAGKLSQEMEKLASRVTTTTGT